MVPETFKMDQEAFKEHLEQSSSLGGVKAGAFFNRNCAGDGRICEGTFSTGEGISGNSD